MQVITFERIALLLAGALACELKVVPIDTGGDETDTSDGSSSLGSSGGSASTESATATTSMTGSGESASTSSGTSSSTSVDRAGSFTAPRCL